MLNAAATGLMKTKLIKYNKIKCGDGRSNENQNKTAE